MSEQTRVFRGELPPVLKPVSNPYDTHHPWNERTLEAWKSMPVNANGHILEAVEENRLTWKKWFAKTPKDLWYPPVIQAYAQIDRSKHGRNGSYEVQRPSLSPSANLPGDPGEVRTGAEEASPAAPASAGTRPAEGAEE